MSENFPRLRYGNYLQTSSATSSAASSPSKSRKSCHEGGQGDVMDTFRTLRQSNGQPQAILRAEKDCHAQVFVLGHESNKKTPRKLEFSSTYKLRDYSHSIYDDFVEVKLFRKSLLDERAKQRAIHLANNQSALSPMKSRSRPGSAAESGASVYGSSNFMSISGPKSDPLSSAKAKLTKYSMSFDPFTPDNQCIILGFHGPRLSRETFGLLIRQCMHIMLSAKEVDSLYATMDISQDGTFDGREFTRKFFNLGNTARREKLVSSARGYREYGRKMTNCERESERVELWEEERAGTPGASPEDAEKVMEKLRINSMKWHHLGTVDPFRCIGFEAYLTPYQFKQQIHKSFEIDLTKAEVSALVGTYKDPSLEGMFFIDGHKFLSHFKGTLHQEAWANHTAEQVKYANHRSKVQSKFFTQSTLKDPLGR